MEILPHGEESVFQMKTFHSEHCIQMLIILKKIFHMKTLQSYLHIFMLPYKK